MIDPSSSEEESDDEQRHHGSEGGGGGGHHKGHHGGSGEPHKESLDIPHGHHAGSHRSLSPNSTTSTDTLNVGQAGSLGSGSGVSNISAGGTPLRGAALQRPTSPSPSLVSEKTVTDSADPQVIPPIISISTCYFFLKCQRPRNSLALYLIMFLFLICLF